MDRRTLRSIKPAEHGFAITGYYTIEGDDIMEYEIMEHVHYAGLPSFNRFKMTRELEGADLAIMGVPFDSGVTNRPGARFGPAAIRQQSRLACSFNYMWDYRLKDKFNIIDYGDVGYYLGENSTKIMLKETYEHAKKILGAGVRLFTLGGDHTIPFGPVRAASEQFGKLALLHFDSHQDSTPCDPNTGVTHANFAYELQKEGCIDPSRSVQVFIRTDMHKCGYNIIYADETTTASPAETAEKIKAIIGDMPVYLTFDIDALDPAYAPGTGTPVIGGPSSAYVRGVLTRLRGLNVVAGDVVEVAPNYDSSEITSVAAAQIAQDIMYLMLDSKK